MVSKELTQTVNSRSSEVTSTAAGPKGPSVEWRGSNGPSGPGPGEGFQFKDIGSPIFPTGPRGPERPIPLPAQSERR